VNRRLPCGIDRWSARRTLRQLGVPPVTPLGMPGPGEDGVYLGPLFWLVPLAGPSPYSWPRYWRAPHTQGERVIGRVSDEY